MVNSAGREKNHLNMLTLAREVRLALAFGDILSRWDPTTVLFGWVSAVSAVLTSETTWVGKRISSWNCWALLELCGQQGFTKRGWLDVTQEILYLQP